MKYRDFLVLETNGGTSVLDSIKRTLILFFEEGVGFDFRLRFDSLNAFVVQTRNHSFEFTQNTYSKPSSNVFYTKSSISFLSLGRQNECTHLEWVWATVPALIILAVFVPSLFLLFGQNLFNAPDLVVKVIGNQWFWRYESSFETLIDLPENVRSYLSKDSVVFWLNCTFDSNMVEDDDLAFGTLRLLEVNNRLTVPVNTCIRFLVTSLDVIHSFAVPEFGVKIDAMPGRLNAHSVVIRRPGIYYGQCSELCGEMHGKMPIVVHVCDYNNWLSKVLPNFSITPAELDAAILA